MHTRSSEYAMYTVVWQSTRNGIHLPYYSCIKGHKGFI